MIRKLRWRFILIMMSIVTVILLAVFVSMLLTTQKNNKRMGIEILQQALEQAYFSKTNSNQADSPHFPYQQAPPGMRLPVLLVESKEYGDISVILNQLYFVEDKDIASIIQPVIKDNEDMGILRDYKLRWMKRETANGVRLAFTDISMEQEIIRNLVINSLMVGGAALIAFFIVSLILARRAVRPVEIAWDRQKQFIADASHELKTPLTVILSNADMLCADESFTDEKKVRRMKHIQDEAVRMKKLVEDLLILAKSDSVGQIAVFQKVDLSYIVTNIILIYEPVIFDEKKKLTYKVQNALMVMGNTERLQQLIHALLDNALKYCPQEGTIQIDLSETERGHILLKVFNEGDPIPQEELEKIFLRFYRRDKSRSAHDSFGLGLSIAYSIVKDHRGKIWADSETGVGNTFYVTLPPAKSEKRR